MDASSSTSRLIRERSTLKSRAISKTDIAQPLPQAVPACKAARNSASARAWSVERPCFVDTAVIFCLAPALAVPSKAPRAVNLTASPIPFIPRQRLKTLLAASFAAGLFLDFASGARAQSLPPVRFVEPALEASAPEGHLRFVWAADPDLPSDAVVVFQRSRSGDFDDAVELYRGRDLGSYVSGLVEGDYHFRIRTESDQDYGPWSEVAVVEVDYVSRSKVTGLMIAGFVVFVITVAAIVGGHLRSRSTRT